MDVFNLNSCYLAHIHSEIKRKKKKSIKRRNNSPLSICTMDVKHGMYQVNALALPPLNSLYNLSTL